MSDEVPILIVGGGPVGLQSLAVVMGAIFRGGPLLGLFGMALVTHTGARAGEATPGDGLKTWQAHVRDWQAGDPGERIRPVHRPRQRDPPCRDAEL